MMAGLPLEQALRMARAQGLELDVRFTCAPRRARQDAQDDMGNMVSRVLRRDGDVLVCARFNEPRLSAGRRA